VWGIVEDHPEMSSDFGIIVAHFQKGKRIDINSMPDKALKSKLGGLFEVLVKHGVLSCDKGERFSGGSAVSSLSLVLELVGERPKKQEKPPIGPTMPPSAAAGPRPPIGPALPPSRKPDVGIEDLLDEEDDFVGPVQVTQGGAPLRSAGEEIERILSCAAADSFQVLGVDPDATTKQVVKRYLKLSLLIHPDKCRLANAAKAFTVLNKAKSDQLDPSKKDDALLWEMAVAEAKRRQESEDWKSIRTTGSVQKAKGPLQREEWLTNKDLPQSSYVPQQKNVTRFTR